MLWRTILSGPVAWMFLSTVLVNALDQITRSGAPGTGAPEVDLGQTVRGLANGHKVFSRYTLKRVLGRGGMGIVWLAHDEKLDRDVALKFVPDMLFLDPAARDDLKRETRRSLELTHPNIVRIYDFMEDESAAAISMEYVDGPTLSQLRVERNARIFEPAEMDPWLGGLCAALDYAHGTARMVHRDLKPANLMLNARGAVKITDFGIACSLMGSVARVSIYSSSAGTLVYMSPQQMQGETPSHLDDIYALGATLYELMTGKPPFYTGNVTLQVLESEVESMAARRVKLGVGGGAIPQEWEEAIAACLSKRPEDRPQCAGELFARLTARGGSIPEAYEVTAPTLNFTKVMKPVRIPAPVIVPTPAAGGSPIAPAAAAAPATAPAQTAAVRIPMGTAVIGAGVAVGIAVVLGGSLFWPHKTAQPVAATVAPAPVAPAVAATATPVAAGALPAAAAPVTAPVDAARGGLMIKTVPAGAMVQLGGEEVETAPAVFKAIPAGKYPVRVIAPDYETAELNVEIKPNEFTDLGTVTLTRSTGSIVLSTSPEGSAYELKPDPTVTDAQGAGLRTGHTPETLRNLPTGTYTLALSHEGWPDQVQTIQVKKGQTLPVDWHFPAGTLALTSNPAGAKVMIGERTLGVTPLAVEVAPGDYPAINVTRDGMVPATLQAKVQEGQTATVDAGTFKPIITDLQLTTDPAGMDYTISGAAGDIRNGQTPAALYDLQPGNYSVTFKRPGWPDFTAPASLQAKTPVTITHQFPEGTVAVTSEPAGAQIYLGTTLLGVAPLSVPLPPGSTELTAKMAHMPPRRHSVTVTEGEDTNLAFDMKSGGSSTSAHHHHHVKKAPPSELARIGDSLKSFFSGGAGGTAAKSRQN